MLFILNVRYPGKVYMFWWLAQISSMYSLYTYVYIYRYLKKTYKQTYLSIQGKAAVFQHCSFILRWDKVTGLFNPSICEIVAHTARVVHGHQKAPRCAAFGAEDELITCEGGGEGKVCCKVVPQFVGWVGLWIMIMVEKAYNYTLMRLFINL